VGPVLPYALAGGAAGTTSAPRSPSRILDAFERYAPGTKAAVVGSLFQHPLWLERELHLPRGNVMHLEMSLDQMFALRPFLGAPSTGRRCPASTSPAPARTRAAGSWAPRVATPRAWSWATSTRPLFGPGARRRARGAEVGLGERAAASRPACRPGRGRCRRSPASPEDRLGARDDLRAVPPGVHAAVAGAVGGRRRGAPRAVGGSGAPATWVRGDRFAPWRSRCTP
jgi:hypothetical protein